MATHNPPWSQHKLAKASGVPVSTVSRVIRGERTASPTVVRRLAAALQVEPAVLSPESLGTPDGTESEGAWPAVVARLVRQVDRIEVRVRALEMQADRDHAAERDLVDTLESYTKRRRRSEESP